MKLPGLILIALLASPMTASGQEASTPVPMPRPRPAQPFSVATPADPPPVIGTPPKTSQGSSAAPWTQKHVVDQLHGTEFDQLVLPGRFIVGSPDRNGEPGFVATCSGGRIQDVQMWVGALVQITDHQSLRAGLSNLGNDVRVLQAFVEKRLDGKFTTTFWTLSQDGESLSVGFDDFAKFARGRTLIVGLVHGGNNYPLQIQFDMPDPAPLLRFCGKTRPLR